MAFARHPTVTNPDPTWRFPVGYGLSETCANVSSHLSTAPLEVQRASAGPLLPGNELRVVDPDTGRSLGPNENGELAVKGPTLQDLERALKKEHLKFHTEEKHHPAHWPNREGRLIVTWEGSKTDLLRHVAKGLDVKR